MVVETGSPSMEGDGLPSLGLRCAVGCGPSGMMEVSDSKSSVGDGNRSGMQPSPRSRLLLCTLCCPWPDRPEQGLYNQEYAASLSELGVETTLFAPGFRVPLGLRTWKRLASHVARPTEYRLGGVKVLAPQVPFGFPMTLRSGALPGSVSFAASLLRRAVAGPLNEACAESQADALLLHGAHPWGAVGTEVASIRGLDTFIIEHSADDLRRAAERRPLGNVYREADAKCAGWITVSEPMRELLLRVVPNARVQVIENGARRPQELPARPADLAGKTLVFSAAHYYKRKGLERLVEAFAEVAAGREDLVLVMATDPPPALRQAMEGLGERARLLGPLSHRDVLKWMAWADLFALPSREEAFGIVYAEALCAGTPVLLSSDSGLANSLRLLRAEPAQADFDGWSVPLDEPASVADALRHATSDVESLCSMGASAQVRALERFDWSRTARHAAEFMSLGHRESP